MRQRESCLHQVSEKPNNNYFSINYVKETPLLPDLWKILGMVGKWNSGLCCLTMTAQSTKIWPLRMFCWILNRLRGRKFGQCADWYVIPVIVNILFVLALARNVKDVHCEILYSTYMYFEWNTELYFIDKLHVGTSLSDFNLKK